MAHLEDASRRSAQEPADTRLKARPGLPWPSRERWLQAAIVVGTLTAWELGVHTGRISSLFFPAPSAIVATFVRLLISGDLISSVGATFGRVILGSVLGGVPGLILGLTMGWSRRLRVLIDPFVAAAHPLPKIAILPLIMIIFGIGESSKIVVVAVSAFFPMLINAMAGVRQISPIYFEVAENYGASPFRVFTRVVVPGSLPMVLAGTRLTLNIALLLTIAVELVAAREGLGAMIWFAWETLRTEELYTSLAAIALVGITLATVIQFLTSQLVRWQVERES